MAVDNTQYKDRLFNFLFGSEENKAWTLSLYNAVNQSSYTDPAAIEITTIKEVMYLGLNRIRKFLNSVMLFRKVQNGISRSRSECSMSTMAGTRNYWLPVNL